MRRGVLPALLTLGSLNTLSAALAQQPLYTEVTDTHLPAGIAGRCMDAATGDADADGNLDLALAMEFEQNILLLNDGSGRFTDNSDRLPREAHDSEEVAFADFDNDGDLDLLVANVSFVAQWSRQDWLLLNDGTGVFTDAPQGALPNEDRDHFTIQVVDLDGDGDTDAIAPSSLVRQGAGNYRILLNDGSGRFAQPAANIILPASADGNGFDIEVADFDGDGLDDLSLCNRSSVANPGAGEISGGQPRLLLQQ